MMTEMRFTQCGRASFLDFFLLMRVGVLTFMPRRCSQRRRSSERCEHLYPLSAALFAPCLLSSPSLPFLTFNIQGS